MPGLRSTNPLGEPLYVAFGVVLDELAMARVEAVFQHVAHRDEDDTRVRVERIGHCPGSAAAAADDPDADRVELLGRSLRIAPSESGRSDEHRGGGRSGG